MCIFYSILCHHLTNPKINRSSSFCCNTRTRNVWRKGWPYGKTSSNAIVTPRQLINLFVSHLRMTKIKKVTTFSLYHSTIGQCHYQLTYCNSIGWEVKKRLFISKTTLMSLHTMMVKSWCDVMTVSSSLI